MHTAERPSNCLLPGSRNNNLGPLADWNLWCRLCAKEDVGNINVLFKDEEQLDDGMDDVKLDMSLAPAIEKYFCVNITRDETLPKMLCTECFTLVTSLVNFTERVTKVQQMFVTLQNTTEYTKSTLHTIRLKFGLLDEEREHVMAQALPEVHYFESKPKINELEENMFDTETETTALNPLAQPRIKVKIKKETTSAEGLKTNDDCTEQYVEDPFVSDDDDDADSELSGGIKSLRKCNTSGEDDINADENLLQVKAERGIEPNLSYLDFSKPSSDERAKITDNGLTINRKRRKVVRKFALKSEDENESEVDDDDNFCCAECPRTFKRLHHFKEHMRRKHAKAASGWAEKKCTECTSTFNTHYQLKKHVQKHLSLAQKKTLPCKYCDKKLTTQSLVQQHIKHVHMDERPFVCEECGVAVRTNAALKTHMLTHTDYAPFACEVCQKGFKNQIRLKKHMETHDPTKHICAECGLQLNSRATLNRHLLVHSDEMTHKCDYCGRAFKRAKALKNHLILHTGLKPYSCDFCERTFANGSNCRSHKKKAHPEELAALEAAGGGKTYTRNIPKLEALKAVTKAADNLEPVVSKQSGNFAFGKKPKTMPKRNNAEKRGKCNKQMTQNEDTAAAAAAATTALNDLQALHASVPSQLAAIPTIDNIYNHIMKQATVASELLPAITIHIKRSPSQASSSASCSNMTQLQQQQTPQSPQQTTTTTTTGAHHHFYTAQQQQQQEQQQQRQQVLLSQQQQQQQHNEVRSSDSQTSHLTADEQNSNCSTSHFYNQIRRNVQGPFI